MHQFFAEAEAARRYDAYRPKSHGIVLDWLRKHCGDRRFGKAIDVGCGTGDSTVPLLEVCDAVLGIDSSEPMLTMAAAKGLNVRRGDYEEVETLGPFDLISTGLAFHWFDPAKAIAAYTAGSSEDAIWLIYNFAFAGHPSNAAFNDWFRHDYLARFPSPPRNKTAGVIGQVAGLELIASETGETPLHFTAEQLVSYLSTQSNIEAAIAAGETYEMICASLLAQVTGLEVTGPFRYTWSYEIHRFRNCE